MKIPLTTVDAINKLSIAAPCPAKWDEMQGDNRVRYCGQCEKSVYDLSEMTSAEIIHLIEETEGQFCAQLYRRHDGTVITADCPVGLRMRMWKQVQKSMAWAASILTMIFLPGCPMRDGSMRMPKDQVITKERPGPKEATSHIQGGIMPMPPDPKQAPLPLPPRGPIVEIK